MPDLFYIECANILLKYIWRFGRLLEDSQANLADLQLLALISTPTADLIDSELLPLATENNLLAYDACYALLAQKLELSLVTADEAILDAVTWTVGLDALDSETG